MTVIRAAETDDYADRAANPRTDAVSRPLSAAAPRGSTLAVSVRSEILSREVEQQRSARVADLRTGAPGRNPLSRCRGALAPPAPGQRSPRAQSVTQDLALRHASPRGGLITRVKPWSRATRTPRRSIASHIDASSQAHCPCVFARAMAWSPFDRSLRLTDSHHECTV